MTRFYEYARNVQCAYYYWERSLAGRDLLEKVIKDSLLSMRVFRFDDVDYVQLLLETIEEEHADPYLVFFMRIKKEDREMRSALLSAKQKLEEELLCECATLDEEEEFDRLVAEL